MKSEMGLGEAKTEKGLTIEEKINILRAPLPAIRIITPSLRTAGNPIGLNDQRPNKDDN